MQIENIFSNPIEYFISVLLYVVCKERIWSASLSILSNALKKSSSVSYMNILSYTEIGLLIKLIKSVKF